MSLNSCFGWRVKMLLAIVPLGVACSSSTALEEGASSRNKFDGGVRSRSSDASTLFDASGALIDAGAVPVLPEHCAQEKNPPAGLDCTGLYADVAQKVLMPEVRAYTPAIALWSDGAKKKRWIVLPEGEQIDNSDPNEWLFPIGTRVFKEFVLDGKRVETRMWSKKSKNFWVNATYQWNEDETAAEKTAGGDIPFGRNGTYHIPTQEECEKCHKGRTDRILGFETVSLALDGAEGVTLRTLIDEDLLTDPPKYEELTIDDDGSGVAPDALGWLHTNCGITCHNGNSRSVGYGTGMFLRLDADSLRDGRAIEEFDILATTIGQPVKTANWRGQLRIAPGKPELSLLYQLISHRGKGEQMPPFASSLVDELSAELIRKWIEHMDAPPVVIDETEPPVVVDKTEPPVVVDETEPPVVVDETEPPVVVDETEPPVVVDETEPPATDAGAAPPLADAGAPMVVEPPATEAGAAPPLADAGAPVPDGSVPPRLPDASAPPPLTDAGSGSDASSSGDEPDAADAGNESPVPTAP